VIEISRTSLKQQSRADRKATKKEGSNLSSSKFLKEVESRISEDITVEINDMVEDLLQQEKKFLDLQSLYELEKYKAIVRKILKMILERSLKSELLELSAREKRLGRSEKQIVKEIDQGLLKLSQLITRKSDAFTLMKEIEEIRGLIFDLIY